MTLWLTRGHVEFYWTSLPNYCHYQHVRAVLYMAIGA